jgi:hypothetical protein
LPVEKSRIDQLDSGKIYRTATHFGAVDWGRMQDFFNYIKSKGDDIWVTTLQEFLEYQEIKRIVGPTKTISTTGNQTVITFSFDSVPEKNRWRDMTLF